jgi:hypothetical protein
MIVGGRATATLRTTARGTVRRGGQCHWTIAMPDWTERGSVRLVSSARKADCRWTTQCVVLDRYAARF